MIVVVFLFILIAVGGGVAAWYFLVYKPGLGPAPAPAYVAAPVAYTTPPYSPPPSTPPSPSPDDDYDPLSLGEVVSPAGSPSAAFSIALWRIQMKKKYSKNLAVLKKRLEVLEDAKDDGKEMSGTVPDEYFDDAIKYLKDLIKNVPKAATPKAPFVLAKWKPAVEKFFEKKTIDDVLKAIDELKAAKKAGMAVKNNVPRAKYADAIDWLETIMKRKERAFDIAKWKVSTKNELKGERPAVITARIDRLKDAQAKKLLVKDGVPRAQYNEAIKWLRVLETEAKKPQAKAKKPQAKAKKPKAKAKKPKAKAKKPKAKAKKPKAKAKKPKAKAKK